MPKSKKSYQIIWAIDPFEKKGETQAAVVSSLRQITAGYGVNQTKIQPVYMLSPSEFDLSLNLADSWSKEYEESTKKILDQCLKNVDLPNLLPPKIIIQRHPSLRESAKSLLTFAKRSRAQLIAVGTHSRKGLFRLFLGSFAETLLLYSKTPLLVVNPSAVSRSAKRASHQKVKSLDKILFATDLGKHAPLLFKKVLEFAKNLQSKIVLFHAISHPVEPLIQSGVYLLSGAMMQWPDFLSQHEQEKRTVAERYASLARAKGVSLEVVVTSAHTNVSSLILEQAKKSQAGLIAMGAESGLVSTTLIGSITRQVAREAPCPIWVMHL